MKDNFPPHDMKHCSSCAKHIPALAKKCSECGDYQDYRSYVPIGSNVLSIILAIFSVMTVLYTHLIYSLDLANSELYLELITCEQESCRLQASNFGSKPAAVREANASIYLPFFGSTDVMLFPDKHVIPANSNEALNLTITEEHQNSLKNSLLEGLRKQDVEHEDNTMERRSSELARGECVISVFHSDYREIRKALAEQAAIDRKFASNLRSRTNELQNAPPAFASERRFLLPCGTIRFVKEAFDKAALEFSN